MGMRILLTEMLPVFKIISSILFTNASIPRQSLNLNKDPVDLLQQTKDEDCVLFNRYLLRRPLSMKNHQNDQMVIAYVNQLGADLNNNVVDCSALNYTIQTFFQSILNNTDNTGDFFTSMQDVPNFIDCKNLEDMMNNPPFIFLLVLEITCEQISAHLKKIIDRNAAPAPRIRTRVKKTLNKMVHEPIKDYFDNFKTFLEKRRQATYSIQTKFQQLYYGPDNGYLANPLLNVEPTDPPQGVHRWSSEI